MEDALRPTTLKVPAQTSVLGGTRFLTKHPMQPPVPRPAEQSIKDLIRYDKVTKPIKRYVELMGERLKEAPDHSKVEPFQQRLDRDLNTTAKPMEIRIFHGDTKKQFASDEVLPRFPVLTSPEKLKAATLAAEKKAEREAKIKASKKKAASR